MTSPVDFISGPRTVSTPSPSTLRNLLKGRTASLTLMPHATPSPFSGSIPLFRSSEILIPVAISAAAFATCLPVALLTNGTVLDALGFASNT